MNIGDYVRTKGCITKIDSCTCWKAKNQWYISYKLPDGSEWASAVTDEFKISPNIIDLISYGDIVKYKIDGVLFISEVWGEENDYFIQNFDVQIDIKDLEIISIVTREMFESMEYKVGE